MLLPLDTILKLGALLNEASDVRKGHPAIAHIALTATATAAAVACATASIGCALAALWLYLLPHVGMTGAPVIIAGILGAMCVALFAVVRLRLRPRAVPPPAATPQSAVGEAERLVRDHRGPVLIGALLAGLIAASGER